MTIHPENTKQNPGSLVYQWISSNPIEMEIMPDYMGFDITSKVLPEKMYAGMIISYKVRPLLGIPMTWVTEISQVAERGH